MLLIETDKTQTSIIIMDPIISKDQGKKVAATKNDKTQQKGLSQ